MHTLNLETLSEERIKKAVDPETFNLGLNLFSIGAVLVEEITEMAALCTVLDKRSYPVRFKIASAPANQLLLKCPCRHASRGLICEHDVAAWLGIRAHLHRQIPPAWSNQLDQVLDIGTEPGRGPNRQNIWSRSYLLFLSLQPDPLVEELPWHIFPYILLINSLPKELRGQFELETWIDPVSSHPEANIYLRQPFQLLDPDDCLNCSRETVNLANLLTERSHRANRQAFNTNGNSANGQDSLQDLLPLIRATGSPLFTGRSSQPLETRLEILPGTADIVLHIDRVETGLCISPHLVYAGREISLPPGGIHQVFPARAGEFRSWILAGNSLFELDNLNAARLLDHFQQQSSTDLSVHVPSEQEQDFIERYLLDLARLFPLGGSVIEWETIEAQPVPRLYLSDANKELQIQLRFGYAQAEVDFASNPPPESVRRGPESWELVRILRKPVEEQASFNLLSAATYGLKRAPLPAHPGLFRLRARTHPVDFLLNSLPALARAGFEIYGEEQLKSARVNRHTPTISFRVSSGIDWFDVQAVVNFGELEVSLPEIRRALRKKERYIKLANGSIGEIPEEWFERYRHLFALAENTPQGIRLSSHHLTLIDEALEQSEQSQTDDEFDRRRNSLRALAHSDFKGIVDHPLPEGFSGELRPYQKAGFDWLHFLHEYRFGGCLADDMGLGKTIQALAFLQSLYSDPAKRPERASLLVVPRSLLVNWQREATRFTPTLRILEFFETDRVKETETFNQVDLVITTYGVMLRDIQLLHGYTFYYAILDESQSIKNPLSQTARAAHLIQASHRLVLTGTPIENSTAELWSQFAFLNPGLLGSLKFFKNEFGLPIEKRRDEKAAADLRRLVFPFIMRRTKDQVAPELPPRSERLLYSDMDPAQMKLYARTRDYFRGLLMGMIETEGLNSSRMRILEGLLRLRQIANHPRLVDEKFRGASGKFELLLDTLETLRSENHKALVFSQFVQMLSLVRAEMDQRNMRYTYLDGQTSDRQQQVDTFQASADIPFFLISLKAGGLGLNLTAADYVIHIDPWWNPAVEMQASDRTHRIGQDKPVFVFKLIARDSVEEKILQLQERKKNLVDQIITTETAFFKNLTPDDVKILFS